MHLQIKTSQLYVRDTTLVTDLGVLLFGGNLSIASSPRTPTKAPSAIVSMKGGFLKWRMDGNVAAHVFAVKEQIDQLMALKIERPEIDLRDESRPLVRLVSTILGMETKPVQPPPPPPKEADSYGGRGGGGRDERGRGNSPTSGRRSRGTSTGSRGRANRS